MKVQMDKNEILKIAQVYLLPFFSGASLEPRRKKCASGAKQVAFDGSPCRIAFKINRPEKYRFILSRSQKFAPLSSPFVTELKVVQAFVDVISEIKQGLDASYRKDLLSTLQRRMVVKSIAAENEQAAILDALDQLIEWATRLYEGRPIAASLGFNPHSKGSKGHLSEVCRENFSSVLSNGYDTIIPFDISGNIVSHESLEHTNTKEPRFSPYRQRPIAEWAQNGKIALVLNRLGEILVFKDRQLVFARRSGRWHFLTHEPIISQIGHPNRSPEIRRAVYESCLDASFARTGACIGIVTSGHRSSVSALVSNADLVKNEDDIKPKTISTLLNKKQFHKLDRRLRQELLAIDGATLIDHKGNVLAVGAILRIREGSEAGGRLAAAKALSESGVGIKVSMDGGISGFKSGSKIFSVM